MEGFFLLPPIKSKLIPFICNIWSLWPHEHQHASWMKSPKPEPVCHSSHWQGAGDGSAPTLFKGRAEPLRLLKLWVFLQASRVEFIPAVFLAGGEKETRLPRAANKKAQEGSHWYFHRAPGQKKLLHRAYLWQKILTTNCLIKKTLKLISFANKAIHTYCRWFHVWRM